MCKVIIGLDRLLVHCVLENSFSQIHISLSTLWTSGYQEIGVLFSIKYKLYCPSLSLTLIPQKK